MGAVNGSFSCRQCPAGSSCVAYTTLAMLPIPSGFYRISNASDDLRRCPDFGSGSGCVGGVGAGEGPCKAWLRGPYCGLCNVSDESRYYSRQARDGLDSACLECTSAELSPTASMLVLLALILTAVVAGPLWAHYGHRSKTPRFIARLSLRAKAKQLLGFYQVATRISSTYEVRRICGAAIINRRIQRLSSNVFPLYP